MRPSNGASLLRSGSPQTGTILKAPAAPRPGLSFIRHPKTSNAPADLPRARLIRRNSAVRTAPETTTGGNRFSVPPGRISASGGRGALRRSWKGGWPSPTSTRRSPEGFGAVTSDSLILARSPNAACPVYSPATRTARQRAAVLVPGVTLARSSFWIGLA